MTRRLQSLFSTFQIATERGLLLFLASVFGIFCANSNLSECYSNFFNLKFSLGLGEGNFSLSIKDWVNDFFMAIFFFTVGMEIKHEIKHGHLRAASQRLLPIVGAIGGVLMPMLIYYFFNSNDVTSARGWAIPSATDIAFTLGVLAIFGSRIPKSLKVFVTALAIIDDLIAVIIVAVFYTQHLHLEYLAYSLLALTLLSLLNRLKLPYLGLYLLVGLLLWYSFLRSGVHATVAGVVLGFMIPIADKSEIMTTLQKALQPLVAYFILPIFAFANSGFELDFSLSLLLSPITLGIALGLFIGKQLGIFSTVIFLIKTQLVKAPLNARILDIYIVSILCGIGFTMSLFITILAFDDPIYLAQAKSGVFLGSLLSFLLGTFMLYRFKNKKKASL